MKEEARRMKTRRRIEETRAKVFGH